MTGGWTVEDAKILSRMAWRICDAAIRCNEVQIAMRVSHWPGRVFVPSQRWVASLNV